MNTPDDKMHRHMLSAEAADELVRYLYLLIDEIQFSRYPEELEADNGHDKGAPAADFDDPIDF